MKARPMFSYLEQSQLKAAKQTNFIITNFH